jgi:SAM-dependent methyltransferase
MSTDTIWQLMATETLKGIAINDLVGGGDPEGVGRLSRRVLETLGVLTPVSRILDIGCGCGRTAAALAPMLLPTGSFVGVDIIPGLVNFCQREIAARHRNFRFYTIEQNNPQYTAYIDSTNTTDRIKDLAELGDEFDLVVAFSVFTHVDRAEAAAMLEAIWNSLHDGGSAVLSFFILNPFSRASIASGHANVFRGTYNMDAEVVIDTFNGPNSAVGFDEAALLELVRTSPFGRPLSIHYGNWSCAPGLHYQDLIVLRKEAVLPSDFNPEAYLTANPDVRRAGMNPFFHYREYGRHEGRRLT